MWRSLGCLLVAEEPSVQRPIHPSIPPSSFLNLTALLPPPTTTLCATHPSAKEDSGQERERVAAGETRPLSLLLPLCRACLPCLPLAGRTQGWAHRHIERPLGLDIRLRVYTSYLPPRPRKTYLVTPAEALIALRHTILARHSSVSRKNYASTSTLSNLRCRRCRRKARPLLLAVSSSRNPIRGDHYPPIPSNPPPTPVLTARTALKLFGRDGRLLLIHGNDECRWQRRQLVLGSDQEQGVGQAHQGG